MWVNRLCGQKAGVYVLVLILAQAFLLEFFGEPIAAFAGVVRDGSPHPMVNSSVGNVYAVRISLLLIIGTTSFFSERCCSFAFHNLNKAVEVNTARYLGNGGQTAN